MTRFQQCCVGLMLATICFIAASVTLTFCYVYVQTELHSPATVKP